MILLRIQCFVLLCMLVSANLPHPLSDEFIDMINRKQTTWKAARNFPEYTSLNHFKNLMGALEDHHYAELPKKRHDANVFNNLPTEFDSRDKWPNCPTLREIRDQGECQSCWALAAAEAMSDRVCIFSNSTKHFHFSAQDLLTCCDTCGLGCYGGFVSEAWEYWKKHGIVSGSGYISKESSQGCQPYSIPPCDHKALQYWSLSPCITGRNRDTPDCQHECKKSYKIDYDLDKHYGTYVYALKEEDNIKADIYLSGPVEATMRAYQDFLAYKSGVYQHIQGDFVGNHAVKIIGWGEENNTKFWLVANSWNTHWGEGGLFRILRGRDHCGIESLVVAGDPLL